MGADRIAAGGDVRRLSWQPTQPVVSPDWTIVPLRIDWIIIPSLSRSWK